MKKITRSFQSDVNNLYPLLEWIEDQTKKMGFSPFERKKINLAIEEAFVNIIFHSYHQKKGIIEVSIERVDELMITFIDYASEFNPLTFIKQIDIQDKTLEEIEEGKLGLFFMQKCMDGMEYKRKEGKNILILKKKLPKK